MLLKNAALYEIVLKYDNSVSLIGKNNFALTKLIAANAGSDLTLLKICPIGQET